MQFRECESKSTCTGLRQSVTVCEIYHRASDKTTRWWLITTSQEHENLPQRHRAFAICEGKHVTANNWEMQWSQVKRAN